MTHEPNLRNLRVARPYLGHLTGGYVVLLRSPQICSAYAPQTSHIPRALYSIVGTPKEAGCMW